MRGRHDMKTVQDMGNSGRDKDINSLFEDILMSEDWWVQLVYYNIAVDQLATSTIFIYYFSIYLLGTN